MRPTGRYIVAWVGAMLACAGTAVGSSVATSLGATDKRELQREVRLIIDLLQHYHYAERAFRDIDGGEIVSGFLGVLDPHGRVLTRADGEFLLRRFGRSLKTVYLVKGDVQPAFEIFDIFAARSRERLDWIDQRLAGAFDFNVDEVIPATDDSQPPADRAEADRRWERRLKAEVIEEILDGRTPEAAVSAVRRTYEQRRRQIAALDALAVRERFLEALVNLFDPHSGYLSAESTREFELGMEGAVGGIGLDLRKEDGRCIVAAVRAGGPAEAHGGILPGDEVIAVADGDQERTTTAVKRMRDIVALLRGTPGSSVRLWVVPAGAEVDDPGQEIVLERGRVVLPEDRARGRVFTMPVAQGPERRVGWIDLPSFYAAGDDAKASSATRDVRELINTMQARGLDALVIDVRRNPGGAVTEAVSLTGLFIPGGPVLATRDLEGKVTELKSEPAPMAFHGPLVVLTSPRSASASEIFAGALRYHRRALVVGGASTFGKGTVQTYIELEKMPTRGTGGPSWGTLRLTSQQFFFPDGSAVQRTGAVSHLVLPGAEEDEAGREAALPHALRAESIVLSGAAPATGDFATVSEELVADLQARMDQRDATLPEFALTRAHRELAAAASGEGDTSLVLELRRVQRAERDAKFRDSRRARWTLGVEEAWPVEMVDTAEVQAALDAQAATMRPRLWPEGEAEGGRLFGNRHWFREESGRLRSVSLDAFPYRDFEDDADTLAAAFAEASGLACDGQAVVAALREIHALERKSARAVRSCFAQHVAGASENTDALARGVDALVRQAALRDGSWLYPGPILDVAARESIRLALDWRQWQDSPAPATPPLPVSFPASAP